MELLKTLISGLSGLRPWLPYSHPVQESSLRRKSLQLSGSFYLANEVKLACNSWLNKGCICSAPAEVAAEAAALEAPAAAAAAAAAMSTPPELRPPPEEALEAAAAELPLPPAEADVLALLLPPAAAAAADA